MDAVQVFNTRRGFQTHLNDHSHPPTHTHTTMTGIEMESHGGRLLMESPWLANTACLSISDYCLIEFSLMSGCSRGSALAVDSCDKT